MAGISYNEFGRRELYYFASGKGKIWDKRFDRHKLSLREMLSQINALTENLGEVGQRSKCLRGPIGKNFSLDDIKLSREAILSEREQLIKPLKAIDCLWKQTTKTIML